jgi:hypothetical protein
LLLLFKAQLHYILSQLAVGVMNQVDAKPLLQAVLLHSCANFCLDFTHLQPELICLSLAEM